MKYLVLALALGLAACGKDGKSIQGPPGTPGTPGTVTSIVQFCPNVQPTYPSTFPEMGLCIDNKLYGVYSANGGFMVELPAGTYTSNGINASCTFVVGSNCQVSQ